jgi:hypothetical protein
MHILFPFSLGKSACFYPKNVLTFKNAKAYRMRKAWLLLALWPLFFLHCRRYNSSYTAPLITGMQPTRGGAGQTVTIRGSRFGTVAANVSVTFNQTPAQTLSVTDSMLTVNVPAGAASGPVKVSINGQPASIAGSFTVLPGTWVRKADLPINTGRGAGTGFSVNGIGYYLGGTDDPDYFHDIYAYDPSANSWTKKSSCPGPGFVNSICFVINNIAYLGVCLSDSGYTKELWAYDPAQDSWTRKADYPGTGSTGLLNFTLGNKGYAGSNAPGGDFWAYDPVGNSWTQKNNLPFGVEVTWPPTFVIGNQAYLTLGGLSNGASPLWAYDEGSDQWTSKASFPYNAAGMLGCAINSTGYLFGFDTLSYAYNPSSNTWTNVAFYGDRGFGALFVIGNNAYFGTGMLQPIGFQKDFWQFTP